jgi:hypothetical protein
MTMRSRVVLFALFLAPCLVLPALTRPAEAGCTHCPKTVFCRPKAPCIKYKCVCPKPICPCGGELENFGYYPTCWRPWPFPPNYSHCPVPPTIATAPCCPNGAPNLAAPGLDQLPVPQMMPPGAGLQ